MLKNDDVETDGRGYSTFHNPEGRNQLTWTQTLKNTLALPLRRHYSHPWFQPVARYGATGDQVDFLEPDPVATVKTISEVVMPKVNGELFFYLNDAVLPLPVEHQWLYGDNTGCMSFFVQQRK